MRLPRPLPTFLALALGLPLAGCAASGDAALVSEAALAEDHAAEGWLSWRGPLQAGVSLETGLVDTVEPDGRNHLWTYPVRGRGTPVVNGDRVYGIGYAGEGAALQEILFCLDAATGNEVWTHRFSDFASDIIYDRYAIGAPVIDAETGNVYYLTTPGLLMAFTADGEMLWQHSMMEEFGRLTFPNGRTGAPVIDGDLVIFASITSHWGPETPARNRFYAFDKLSGEHVWTSTPGETPKDNPYSYPVLAMEGDTPVLYAGTGCGNLVCINSRTGEPRWRMKMSIGGVNSAPVVYGDKVIALHGRENMDSSRIGRMISIDRNHEPTSDGAVEFGAGDENWRADLGAFTSSPVLVGNRVYQTVQTGELTCVDADTGDVLWHEKLAPDQIHASPVYADGKLYVPMNNGSFHIIRPTDAGPEKLCTVQLEGSCLGAPAVWNGRIYVHTTEQLYCFGAEPAAGGPRMAAVAEPATPAPGAAASLQAMPGDILLAQGGSVAVHARTLDARGYVVAEDVETAWSATPNLDVELVDGVLNAKPDARTAVGMVTAAHSGLVDKIRVRIIPALPMQEDFEGFRLEVGADGEGVAANNPAWLGTSRKWEVRERDGSQVFARMIDNPLFQRSFGFFGLPEMSDYTMQMDIMSDGNRRTLSSAGFINQRYIISLNGNYQSIEIVSNEERLKERVPFKWKAKTWYTLKGRVDVNPDGSGVVRAKAWERGTPEPDAWNAEVEVPFVHLHGAPGLWAFTPQSRFRVYVDNINVTPNE